ncbi:MAG: hypothetical protein ACXWW4_15065, partial [Candidatus Binatia bacterium]
LLLGNPQRLDIVADGAVGDKKLGGLGGAQRGLARSEQTSGQKHYPGSVSHRNSLSPACSITLSARTNTFGGIARPIRLAAGKFVSNELELIGCASVETFRAKNTAPVKQFYSRLLCADSCLVPATFSL